MTSIATIANDIGISDRPGERAVTMAIVGGRVRHAYLADAVTANVEVDDPAFEALYAAGGLFRDGSIQGNQGRSQANLTRVLWLQFDADLLDFFGATGKDDRTRLLEQLGEADQAEIDAQVALLRAALEETFTALRIPIHRLDYTGYGLCAYVYIDPADQTRIDDCRAAHARLVTAINQRYGSQLVDDQVKDAGTRVTRLPGSYNRKGRVPRLVTTLVPWDGSTAPLGVNPESPRPIAHVIPTSGPGMAAADIEAFIAAVKPSWNLGQKHAMALAVAALLAKARIPEAQAAAIVERLSADDTKPWDRRAAVVSTYNRMRAGGAIAGYSALVGMMDAPAVAFVDQLLSRYRQATSGTVSIGELAVVGKTTLNATIDETELYKRRERQVVSLASAPPESAFYGWFADYRDAVSDTTEASDALHLGASLAVAGAMIGRRIGAAFGSDDVYPMLYMVLVGATGWSRKETAMKRALDQLPQPPPGSLQAVSPSFTSIGDISSAEGLADVLEKSPNTLVRLAELTLLFANMERKGTKNLPDRLINLWDAPDKFEVIRTGGRSTTALRPALSILAATQPGRLADAMTQEHMLSGFANRLTFVTGKPKPAVAEPKPLDKTRMWRLYRDFLDAIHIYPDGSALPRSKKTDDRWNDWYLNQIRKSTANDEESEAMRARHQMMALKIALIYAVSDRSPAIELHHLEPAIAFVEWMWRNLIVLMRSWGVAYWSQIERKIEDVLIERGPMRRGALGKACSNRKWNTRDFGMVLDALSKNERVFIDAAGICQWVHDHDEARTRADATRTVGGHFADNDESAESGGFTGDLRA